METQVAAAIAEIAASSEDDARAILSNLKITGVKKILAEPLHVLIVSVPYKQIGSYHTVGVFLITELEKKLGNVQVTVVARRRTFPRTPQRG